MRWFQVVLPVSILVGVFVSLTTSLSLSEIQYRFTTCGSSGNNGPTIEECEETYENVNSPITEQERLFSFSGEDRNSYSGAQGFRVPRPGIYNVTVAGAAGGRGVCNTKFGHGAAHEFQLRLTPSYELLILVGQKGRGPCDTNPNHFLCGRPPKSMQHAIQCAEEWYNWTRTLNDTYPGPPIEGVSIVGDVVDIFNGGAGGGGASMMWARFSKNKTFQSLPLFVSAGGGGSSALLNYNVSYIIRANIPTSINSNEQLYTYFLNGRSLFIPRPEINSVENFGDKGVRRVSVSTAGVGGGFFGRVPGSIETDGSSLSQEDDLAEGGLSCANEQFKVLENSNIFLDLVGGFGGGGGGCGGGGGGGGYSGGSVLDSSNDFPGGGGYSDFTINDELEIIKHDRGGIQYFQNDGNGYITIAPADCGCSDGLCAVNNELNSFECMCKNENHTLAENGFDCYRQTRVGVQQETLFTRNGYTFKALQLINMSVLALSARLSLRLVGNDQGNASCAVVFLGEEQIPRLTTEVVRANNSIVTANLLSRIYVEDNDTISTPSNYEPLLEGPELVTGAVIISNGNCSLIDNRISMNVSTRRGPESDIDTVNFTALVNLITIENVQTILQIKPTQPPSAPRSLQNIGLIVGLLVAIIVVLILIVLVIIVGVILYSRVQKRRDKQTMVLSPNTSEATLLSAPRYAELEPTNLNSEVKYDEIEEMKARQQLATGYSEVDVNVRSMPIPSESNTNDQDVGYSTLTYDVREYELPMNMSLQPQFKSKYGVIAPVHDFTHYNRERAESAVDNWQYPRSKLIYMRELGEGQFGKVLLMKAKGIAGFEGKIPVAVKTLTSRDPEVIRKFMEEAELMKKFTHPNIVSLLGVSSKSEDDEDEDSAPLMILEYMPYGDLQNFLENHKPNELGQTSVKETHFYMFVTNIARALEFLSARKYVHRDVAARNCLVGPDLHIKIADFGMSRGVYDKDYYRIAGRAVLPVRWMSPESLLFGMFSSASDVWAFGVTIWEIVSYGETPLEEMEVKEIIEAAQEEKLKHERPPGCPDDLYTLICQCHAHDVDQRITFPEILKNLEARASPAKSNDVQVDNETQHQDNFDDNDKDNKTKADDDDENIKEKEDGENMKEKPTDDDNKVKLEN